MRSLFVCLAAAIPLLYSCQVTVDKGNKSRKVRNDISISSAGLAVEQAFLLYEDGTLVPPDNKVEVNQKIILRLITSGWKEKNGKVYISGGETVETSEGDTILHVPELLQSYDSGISPQDARFLSINVVITSIDKLYDYYKVSFFIKDRLEPRNHAEGYYRLYLK